MSTYAQHLPSTNRSMVVPLGTRGFRLRASLAEAIVKVANTFICLRETFDLRFSPLAGMLCSFCHKEIFFFKNELVTKSDGLRGVRVRGHVLLWLLIHSRIAARSKLRPARVMSGSIITSEVIGQMNSSGGSISVQKEEEAMVSIADLYFRFAREK